MVAIKKEGILLKKTRHGFENEAVINPAAIRVGNLVHLFYRAVRKGNYSTIGHCILDGPLNVIERKTKPVLIPEYDYESQGIEDPRIVKIEAYYYLTYAVYDRVNVFGSCAVTSDLKVFQKQGIITPKITFRAYKHLIECCQCLAHKYYFYYDLFKAHGLGEELADKLFVWDKNIVLFPKKIKEKFALLHRIHPGIQIVYFENFSDLTDDFWKNYIMDLDKHIVMDPIYPYESSHIGAGCPPIETKEGWLLIYHAVEDAPEGFIYHASVALLDLENPQKIISRLASPLFSPTLEWELNGVVNNVVFPTGAVIFDDLLYIYYGAADTRIGTASLNVNDLLSELKNAKNKFYD